VLARSCLQVYETSNLGIASEQNYVNRLLVLMSSDDDVCKGIGET
jgi:hypothetical protein